MDEHYICTGTCAAVVDKAQFDAGLTSCQAPQGCTMKGHAFVKCVHCPRCDHHVPEGEDHSCGELHT